MDDLKLFAKNEKEIDSLVQTVRIFSDDIGMKFGLEKCAAMTMKRGTQLSSLGEEEVSWSAGSRSRTAQGIKIRGLRKSI